MKPLPIEEYHEDLGPVLWWKFPIEGPPYCGGPNDLGNTVEITVQAFGVDKMMRVLVGGWPGYHTHWTPIEMPETPEADRVRRSEVEQMAMELEAVAADPDWRPDNEGSDADKR